MVIKMVYTLEEKRKMDVLYSTLADYIKNQPDFDWVYSDKLGYLEINYGTPTEIHSADHIKNRDAMLECFFFVVSFEVRALHLEGTQEDFILSATEIEEIRRRVEPILDTLPEDKEYCIGAFNMFLNVHCK